MAQTSLNSTGVASSGALSLQSNGTTEAIGISTGQVATLAQNPILTSGTANGVAYLNGSKVLTTGSTLVFDGSNLGVGVTPSAWSTTNNTKAIQFSTIGSAYQAFTGVNFASNMYYDGTADKYIQSSLLATKYSQSGGVHAWFNAPSGTAGNAISFTQAMTLDASGNLLVGATSGSTNIFKNDRNGDQTAYFQNTNSSAPFGIYLNYPNAAPNNTGSWFISCRDSGTNRMQVYSNGGIANFSGNNVNLSDRREKTNFAPAKSYLETICAIPVQTYNYINQNMEEDGGLTLGVVAQDVQAVAPELVMESNWGTKDEPKQRLSIYQTDLQYALMKCIQEQQAIITTLTARISALESK